MLKYTVSNITLQDNAISTVTSIIFCNREWAMILK